MYMCTYIDMYKLALIIDGGVATRLGGVEADGRGRWLLTGRIGTLRVLLVPIFRS